MKTALYVDCCIRAEQSRTRQLSAAFFSALSGEYRVTRVDLTQEELRPLMGAFLEEREALLRRGELTHPRFDRARQLAAADGIGRHVVNAQRRQQRPEKFLVLRHLTPPAPPR